MRMHVSTNLRAPVDCPVGKLAVQRLTLGQARDGRGKDITSMGWALTLRHAVRAQKFVPDHVVWRHCYWIQTQLELCHMSSRSGSHEGHAGHTPTGLP